MTDDLADDDWAMLFIPVLFDDGFYIREATRGYYKAKSNFFLITGYTVLNTDYALIV